MNTEKLKKRVQRYESNKKHIDGSGGKRQRKEYGANSLFSKKISKNEKLKIEKNFGDRKTKNLVYFQMHDAVKYQIMPFKGIFSPVERKN